MGVFLPGDLAKRLDRPAPGGHTFPGLSTELRILFGSPNGVTLKLLIFSAVALAWPCYGQQRPAPSAEDVFATRRRSALRQRERRRGTGARFPAARNSSPRRPRRSAFAGKDEGRTRRRREIGRAHV